MLTNKISSSSRSFSRSLDSAARSRELMGHANCCRCLSSLLPASLRRGVELFPPCLNNNDQQATAALVETKMKNQHYSHLIKPARHKQRLRPLTVFTVTTAPDIRYLLDVIAIYPPSSVAASITSGSFVLFAAV